MARKALVEIVTGLVLNVIAIDADSKWVPPAGQKLVDAATAGSPGDTWDGVRFVPRPPSAEETAALRREEAKGRAIAAIKANKGGAPWGVILYDLAVAQGWLEETTP